VRVLVVVTAVAALVAGGCGSKGPSQASRRKAVTQYINTVNANERVLSRQLQAVSKAYRSFSGNAAKLQSATPSFRRAESTLRLLRGRIARVAAPVEARVLRKRLLALVDAEIELAHEVTMLASFLPRFQAALVPLNGARKTLQTTLAKTPIPQPKRVPKAKLKKAQAAYAAAVAAAAGRRADALAVYLDSVARIAASVRRLEPPPVMAPTWSAELRALTAVQAAGASLAAALRDGHYKAVPTLSRSFQAAALTSGSTASQLAEIAAVKAYDARVKSAGALAVRVEKERTRLQKLVG
jgi:hypothetical protein